MQTFNAFRVHTIDGKAICRYETLGLEDLDAGPVLIRTEYSAITYKDAMAARGVGKNVRTDRPCVTGVDLSGVVVTSEDERFREGDLVVVTNYKLGTEHDGAYAEYTRVPTDWIVPLPDGLSLYEAMALGTSGLTAALAVNRLEQAGLQPSEGPVAVSGATGGVGSLMIDMLARHGYEVVAISGKREQEGYLRSIGATRVIARDQLYNEQAAMVSGLPFAAAMDTVGGRMLDRLLAHMKPHGKIAIAGMIDVGLHTTVLPFVLRSVDILGINVSRQLTMPERRHLWRRMASDLKPLHLDKIARRIPFNELDRCMDSFFDATTVGRVVVEVAARAGC